MQIVSTCIRRDPPDTRWLAELTLSDGRVIRRRGPSKDAAEAAVRAAAAAETQLNLDALLTPEGDR